MKRPLMIIGFSLFVSLAVFSSFSSNILFSIAITFAVVLLGLFLFAFKHKLYNAILIFFSGFLASILLICSNHFFIKPLEKLDNKYIETSGYITRVDDTSYVLKCTIDDQFFNIYVPDYSATPIFCGDNLNIAATIKHINFTKDSYLRSKALAHNCYFYCETPDINKTTGVPFQYKLEEKFFELKNYLTNIQEQTFHSSTFGFINGITLGNRRLVPHEIKHTFKRAGLSHVLVISGMHLSIISGIVFTLLRRFGKRKAAIISVFVTLFYMALTGFETSITRAGIMNIIMYLAVAIIKDYDPLTSVATASLIMCFINPFCAADISLQLSIVSTAGIVYFLPPARKFVWKVLGKSTFFKRLVMRLFDFLIITLSANFVLMPFYVFVFGNISIVAPLSNIIASFLTPFVVTSSLIATAMSCIPFVAEAAFIPAFLANISSLVIIKSAEFFSNFRFASVGTEYTFMIIWVVASAVLIGYAVYKKNGLLNLHAIILSIIVLFASIFCYNICNSSKIAVKVVPSYSNGCMVLKHHSHTTLICGLGENDSIDVLNYGLLDAGITKIDLLVVGKNEKPSNLILLAQKFNIDMIVFDNSEIDSTTLSKLNELDVSIKPIQNNQEIDIGNKTMLTIRPENILIDVDGVVFNMNFGEVNFLDDFDLYSEIDVLLLGETKPIGLDYLDLSYIVFTNYETENLMYKNTAYYTDGIAFCRESPGFMVEDGTFYITKEWG